MGSMVIKISRAHHGPLLLHRRKKRRYSKDINKKLSELQDVLEDSGSNRNTNLIL